MAALFGTALLSIPFAWTASYSEGFAAGLAGMVAVALGTAAGGAGEPQGEVKTSPPERICPIAHQVDRAKAGPGYPP